MKQEPLSHRSLGTSDIMVSPVALGCWPIAGMTSLDVNDQDSLATLRAALDQGVNFLDTAYCYGANGESERLISQVVRDCRDQVVIATKGGIHWDADVQRHYDGTPETIKRECDESLARLGTDYVDLLYLHAPDPSVPVSDSAGAFKELLDAGKTRLAGASNFSVEQLEQFHAVCPISVVQPPFNMLQRQIEADILPWCQVHQVSLAIYWPLMKGLLAGKLKRDHEFQSGDGRAKYPMFQGDEWQRNQDFVDDLRLIATELGITVAQLVINWTLLQPGITVALCGAKRAYQIEETAAAMSIQLEPDDMKRIDDALARRGNASVRGAV